MAATEAIKALAILNADMAAAIQNTGWTRPRSRRNREGRRDRGRGGCSRRANERRKTSRAPSEPPPELYQ